VIIPLRPCGPPELANASAACDPQVAAAEEEAYRGREQWGNVRLLELVLETTKTCRICKVAKPLNDFQRRSESADGYRNDCRDCRAIYYSEWRKKHLEEQRQISREYAANHREKSRARANHWRINNPSQKHAANLQWARKNRDKAVLSNLNWRRRNPEKGIVYANARRAREADADGSFDAEEWRVFLQAFGGKCVCCGRKAKLTVDHIVPLSCGGTNHIENLQPLCLKCNSAKGTKTINFLVAYEAT